MVLGVWRDVSFPFGEGSGFGDEAAIRDGFGFAACYRALRQERHHGCSQPDGLSLRCGGRESA